MNCDVLEKTLFSFSAKIIAKLQVSGDFHFFLLKNKTMQKQHNVALLLVDNNKNSLISLW